jgi:hypothetical protein
MEKWGLARVPMLMHTTFLLHGEQSVGSLLVLCPPAGHERKWDAALHDLS